MRCFIYANCVLAVSLGDQCSAVRRRRSQAFQCAAAKLSCKLSFISYIQSAETQADFAATLTRFREKFAELDRVTEDRKTKLVRSNQDIVCLFNDRDRLESLAKNDWTPFVWRKTVTRESNQRKNRYEQLAKEFREASRTEVNDCLGQMLTTCLQNSPHVEANNSFFLAAINVSEDKVREKSAR